MSKILYAASTYEHIKSFHLDYIDALRAEGHEVLIMANGPGADFNVPFAKRIFSNQNRKARKQIRQIIEAEGFDKILVNTTLAAFHIRLALGIKSRPRTVNFVHGYLFSKKTPLYKRLPLLLCEKLLASRTDAILVMNREDEEIATEHKLSHRVIFTRGMGVKDKPVTKSRSELRAELGLCEGDYVLTYAAELSARKNQLELVCALALLKEIPSIKLLLLGEGEKREELLSQIEALSLSDRVRLLGRRIDVQDVIAAADLYVSTSRSEGLPFNVAEALAKGKTVIASDVKGHTDLIEHGKSGYLYPPSSHKALALLIKEAYEGKSPLDPADIISAYERYSYNAVFSDTLAKIKISLEI